MAFSAAKVIWKSSEVSLGQGELFDESTTDLEEYIEAEANR